MLTIRRNCVDNVRSRKAMNGGNGEEKRSREKQWSVMADSSVQDSRREKKKKKKKGEAKARRVHNGTEEFNRNRKENRS